MAGQTGGTPIFDKPIRQCIIVGLFTEVMQVRLDSIVALIGL